VIKAPGVAAREGRYGVAGGLAPAGRNARTGNRKKGSNPPASLGKAMAMQTALLGEFG